MGSHETLESRIALSHATIQLGAVQPGLNTNLSGSVAHGSSKAYEFQVNSSMIVGSTLSGLSSKAELVLLDTNRRELASFSNGTANDSFRYAFSPGTYYAEVIGHAKRNAHYHININAAAIPVSKPVPPPSSSKTTGASKTGGNTGSKTGGNSGSVSSGHGGSSGMTVEQFATNLSSAISKSVNTFAVDASNVEVYAPTIGFASIGPELVQVDKDALKGNDFQAFADIQTLGKTMLQEAEYTVYWGYPLKDAILDYTKVVTDLENVAAVKEISVAFLQYLASRLPRPSTGATPGVWSSGLLGSGSSGGVLNQSNQAIFTGYSSSDLNNVNSHLYALNGEIASDDLWNEEAQQFDPYESITEDNIEEANDPSLDPELTSIENEDPVEGDSNLG